jgi:adenosylcobinamide-GDP ribazoletransferase
VVPGLLATLLLVPAWVRWLKQRIGGISGDGHGAGIEIVETGLLLVFACLR